LPDPTILILVSLTASEKHGYAIMEDVQAFADIRLGPGTLYGAITRLEQRGWIQPVGLGERRQPYRITAAGREYLELQLLKLNQVSKVALRRLRHA
jgi:DNA-binding PadR family transcriptional regulator